MPEVLRGIGVAEAIEHLRRLNIVTRAEWDRLAQAQQRAAFTAAGVENRAALEALRKLVTEGLDKAWGSAQFETAATKLLAHFQTEAGSLRTLWNTVTAKSMAAGRAEMLKDPEVLRVVPYQMYDAFLDAVTRPNHRALDGAIAPAEWDGWNFYGPPNGFNCRCNLVSLTRREGERRLAAGGRFFDLRNGVPTVSAPPAGPDPGWTKFGEAASFADPERSNAQPRDLSSGVRRPAVKMTGSAEPETVAMIRDLRTILWAAVIEQARYFKATEDQFVMVGLAAMAQRYTNVAALFIEDAKFFGHTRRLANLFVAAQVLGRARLLSEAGVPFGEILRPPGRTRNDNIGRAA